MKRYITRRLLLLIPTLLLVSFLVFCIVRIIPGDAVTLMVAEMGFAEDEAELRAVLGLDQSLPRQYLNYMANAVRGDLGTSLWSGQPVLEEITRRLPLTFRLALMALFWTLLTGIPLGVISAL
ncbi:MAG: ABC transporter permease, partial [Desulfatitalea sp.]|nr:ABC transporter permease [Desulfatitalea sp.]